MFRNRRREGGENVEERVRLIIQTARPEYFLGESIALQFIVVNEGTSPLEISVGGDYRGVGRHLRYKVSAMVAPIEGGDEEKVESQDNENAMMMCFGGLSTTPNIAPGNRWSETITLEHYIFFKKAGVYRISCTHDLGLQNLPEPGQLQLVLKVPERKEAKRILKQLLSGQDTAAFSSLQYSVYLPLLKAKILGWKHKNKTKELLYGIESIKTPESTQLLIELGSKSTFALREDAVKFLIARLPNPKLKIESVKAENERIVSQSWREEFSLPVREIAKYYLSRMEFAEIELGGSIFRRWGNPEEDLNLFPACFINVLKRSRRVSEEQEWPRYSCTRELLEAARYLIERASQTNSDWLDRVFLPEISSPTAKDGHLMLYSVALEILPSFRPEGWQARCVDILLTRREDALPLADSILNTLVAIFKSQPSAPTAESEAGKEKEKEMEGTKEKDGASEEFLQGLTKALPKYLDPTIRSWETKYRTCDLISRFHLPLKDELVAFLKKESDNLSVNGATNALIALGHGKELLMMWVDRLDDVSIGLMEASSNLKDRVVLSSSYSGFSSNSHGWDDLNKRRALKNKWVEFINDNVERLVAGRLFDLAVEKPPADLFPNQSFGMKDGSQWPPSEQL